jgi:ferrous iron transport protein A
MTYGMSAITPPPAVGCRAIQTCKRSKLSGLTALDRECRLLNKGRMSDTPNPPDEVLLGNAPRGFVGIIRALKADSTTDESELERQLLEMGFTEGARVEILHEGAVARDPIAVRVDSVTVALRRREAMAIVVS